MSRSRNRLHVNKLDAFAAFLKGRGWVAHPVKDPFEVLRMRHPDSKFPLIVHGREKTDNGKPLVHCTTWGVSERMLNLFLKENNNAG